METWILKTMTEKNESKQSNLSEIQNSTKLVLQFMRDALCSGKLTEK